MSEGVCVASRNGKRQGQDFSLKASTNESCAAGIIP